MRSTVVAPHGDAVGQALQSFLVLEGWIALEVPGI